MGSFHNEVVCQNTDCHNFFARVQTQHRTEELRKDVDRFDQIGDIEDVVPGPGTRKRARSPS